MQQRSTLRRPTRLVTLYRLTGVRPDVEGMFDVLDTRSLATLGFEVEIPPALLEPSLTVRGAFERDIAEWCGHFSVTTGLVAHQHECRGASLLMIAVDGIVYAIGYGEGHRLVPDGKKDPRFGLRFAVRVLNPRRVKDLVRRSPALYGRTDATLVPGGMPIEAFGVEEHAEVVGRAGGTIRRLNLTCSRDRDRDISIEGAAGLRVRMGVRPADLISDLREIASVLSNDPPQAGLEFIENIEPVDDEVTEFLLDCELDEILGGTEGAVSRRLHAIVPTTKLNDFGNARTFVIKIGSISSAPRDAVELADILRRTRVQSTGSRVSALRSGRIDMYADGRASESLSGSSAIKWLEAVIALDGRRFFLMDGSWYEIGAHYLAAKRREIERLMSPVTDLDLPEWKEGWSEQEYNQHVQDARGGYLCLDRKGIRTKLHSHNGIEACDVLSPDDTLIHIKKASSSAPLSHLFNQGLVAVETLATPEGAAQFASVVHDLTNGRRIIDTDFRPRRVVFAILLKNGEDLTADTLFPFSQVTLAYVARTLRHRYGVGVELIGIKVGPSS